MRMAAASYDIDRYCVNGKELAFRDLTGGEQEEFIVAAKAALAASGLLAEIDRQARVIAKLEGKVDKPEPLMADFAIMCKRCCAKYNMHSPHTCPPKPSAEMPEKRAEESGPERGGDDQNE